LIRPKRESGGFPLDRFGTTFEVKTVEQRVISGHAAAWSLDRVGDVIDKAAFRKTLSEKRPSDVAVFIGHKADELPVGVPLTIEADEHGLFTTVKVFDGPAGDNLLAVAKGLKAAGQTLGLSIGFRIRDARMERLNGKSIRRLTDIDLIEFSYAARQTVANPAALMTSVKTTGGAMRYSVEKTGEKWAVMRDGKAIGAPFDDEETAKAKADALNADGGKTHPNSLPDSAFLYVGSGGQLDDEGKTVPRSLRHFQYRSAAGELDEDAIKMAVLAIPEAKAIGLSESDAARLQARARTLLESAGTLSTKTVDADAAEWRAGVPIAIRGVGYRLIDLSEQIASELKAMTLLGEDTKSGQRMRAEMRHRVTELAHELGEIVELAERATRGEDGRAKLALYQQQLAMLGV